MRSRMWIATGCIVAIVACRDGEREAKIRETTSRLQVLQEEYANLSRRLADRDSTIAAAENRLSSLNADVSAQNLEVQSFLANHKVAAACIRAAKENWSPDNVFAQDVSKYSRIGAALCTVALLNRDFAREVGRVTSHLEQADVRVRDLKSQIELVKQSIETQRADVRNDEAEIDRVAGEIAMLQREIE